MGSEAVEAPRVSRVDISHLLSKEQIEVVRASTNKGDYIKFWRGGRKIKGTVDKMYEYIFILEDGRAFSWIDYITGSSEILTYLKRYHPVQGFEWDSTFNYYKIKMTRTD